LSVWDDQLCIYGDHIYKKREHFIHELVPVFQHFYNHIAVSEEEIGLDYVSHLQAGNMKEILTENLEKDRLSEYTTGGIHKDDLLLKLKGYPIKTIGSQGQQKTYLVSLKLAQFEFICRISGFKPVLLLDDIFDKLDAQRVRQIVSLVAGETFGQIFITDTSGSRLKTILDEIKIENTIFRITNGMTEPYA
jgi:DNA replication and repair protein RecF